ncbi:MAG: class I SAM-dependent methyltransferase [Chloroflexi bacterium]|nr:class I SAM-dependent methyltransferase [Chloroflexota bacterium]
MLADDLGVYYNRGREQERLSQGSGRLELARTQEIILRYLPPSPATVLDIGGGAGVYALWLARAGYTVHLMDLIPLHIEQASLAAAAQPDHPLASARVGNALQLDFPDACAGGVLLLGPLYHLTERGDRLQALREAYRVLKPSGLLFAATISRFASFLDGLMRGYLADAHFAELAAQDLIDGQHRNPSQQPGYFTTAYFHYPTEIQQEVTDAGFQHEATLVIEGPAGFMPDFNRFWDDAMLRRRLLEFLRTIERDPAIIGATGHLMTVGRKR